MLTWQKYITPFAIDRVDMRSNNKNGDAILIHKKGSKVVGIHCNPLQPDILLTCGNDHYVSSSRLFIY